MNTVPSLGSVGGAALAGHLDVDKVAFTGSTATGRRIMEAAAKSNLKKVCSNADYLTMKSKYTNNTHMRAPIGIIRTRRKVAPAYIRVRRPRPRFGHFCSSRNLVRLSDDVLTIPFAWFQRQIGWRLDSSTTPDKIALRGPAFTSRRASMTSSSRFSSKRRSL